MSDARAARGALVRATALIGLLSVALAGCEDLLLQEPDTGIAAPLALEVVSGDDQTAEPGATLPAPLRVKLVDLRALPTERLRIEWVVLVGSGKLSPANTFTNGEGIAETTWTLGSEAGRQVVEARFGDESVAFEATGK